MRIFLFTALRALRTQQQERLPTQQGNPAGGYESTIHRLRYRCAVVCVGLLSLWGANLFAQSDPLALQQQAIRRIDDFIDNFRRSGDFQSRRADLLQADAELSQSNRVLAERGDWKNLALGLIKQGTAWRMQGQWPRAIALYEQAAQAAQRAGHTGHHADALSWKALAESSRNNLGQAQVDAMQALRLAEASKDKTLLARALNVLGVVQGAQRDLAGAADTANREIAVAAEAADPMASYYAYLNRSDVYLKTGERCDFQRAFEACFKALDLARDDLRQAESIVRRLGYGGLERQTQGLMQGVESRRALVKSQQSHEKVLDKSNIFRPKQPKDVLVSEGFVTGLDNVPPQLTAMLQAAKRQEQQAGGFAQSSQARSLYTEGLLHEMQGRNDDALSWYRKAVDVLERDRRSLRDERSRGSFMEDRITIYYAAVLQLLQQRRHAEAFEMLERSRSRALTDLLASRKLDVGNGEEQTLYAEAATLRARIADAQGRLLEASGQGAARAEAEKALGDRINADEARYQSVLGRMAATAPRLHKLVESAPTSLAALQDSMRSERYETLQYLVTESAVILWHITPDSVYVRNVFLPRTHVMSKVAAVGNSLRNPGRPFDEATAGELFLYLVQPVLARLNSERLVIIPHEDLGNLPFQVLRNPADGRYFGERFQISYAPSATVLLGLRRSTNLGGASVAAFADPAVEGAAQEVQSIGKLFAGRRHVRGDALPRKQEVKGLVADFEVVHLAVHGSFDAGEPMLSYLKLARGAGDDGKLTAAEMFGLPLAKSRLVVLSACETGRVETTHANEMLGMSRALLYAGASALLLSQWRISSAATTQWMQTFYEAAVSRPPAEAARLASLQMMKDPRTSHPFYWAPFTLIAR